MKTINVLKSSVMCLAILGGVGCTSSENNKPYTIDVGSLHKTNESPAQKAENIALAGEQLMIGGAFMYADKTFDVALAIDKNNARANLYKRVVALPMRFKGILTRVRPLLTTEEREKLFKGIDQSPDGALKTFLTDGSEDLRNERDIQNLVDGFIQDLNSLRTYLKTTKDQEVVLNLPAEMQEKRLEQIWQRCQWQETSSQVYENNCDMKDAFTFKMNRADKEAVQQIVAGYQVYLSVLNAYSMDGVLDASQKEESSGDTPDYVRDFLAANPNWGVLRHPELLSSIVTMGNDAIKGIRWAQANQSALCPTGVYSFRSRKGHLFEDGICVKTTREVTRLLAIASHALNGGIVEVSAKGGGDKVALRPAHLLTSPVRDLKSQLPIVTDECGRLISMPDRTLGGLVPNGDAHKLFEAKCGVGQ